MDNHRTSPAVLNLFVTSDGFTRWMQCSGPLLGASRKIQDRIGLIYSVLLGWIQASNLGIIVRRKKSVCLASWSNSIYCH
jgi:hypothetical protein